MKVKSKMRLWQHVSKIRSPRSPNASEKRKRWNNVKVKVYWMWKWKMRQMWYKERKKVHKIESILNVKVKDEVSVIQREEKVHKSESILTAKVKVSERWARQMRCDSRSISPISTLDHPYAAARLHNLRQPISALHTGPKSLKVDLRKETLVF